MAMANVDLKKILKEYKEVARTFKTAEDRKAELKDSIIEEMEVRGIPYVQGEKSKTKTVEVDGYAAVLTTFGKESVKLAELVKEFGRDLLESKKLINAYPVESLKVDITKGK